MTPFLIFLVSHQFMQLEINNILSVSGSMTHWFKNTLDYKMGLMIKGVNILGTNFFKEKEN